MCSIRLFCRKFRALQKRSNGVFSISLCFLVLALQFVELGEDTNVYSELHNRKQY